jgi:hypothetical protein
MIRLRGCAPGGLCGQRVESLCLKRAAVALP